MSGRAPAVRPCWGPVVPLLASTPLLGPWDVLGIVVAAVVAVLALTVLAVRAWREARRGPSARPPAGAAGGAAAAGSPLPGLTGLPAVGRRRFLEQGVLSVFGAALVGVVTSASDYMFSASNRRRRRYVLGSAEGLLDHLRSSPDPYYDPVGGFYVVAYPAGDLPEAERVYRGAELTGMEEGFVALDQACTHLGCRVPFCRSSQWFECPCHGSRFNAVGEVRTGPAPRGLDRYAVRVEDGRLVVDTGHKVLGPPPGTDTTGQRPAGPHCN